jgi:hypothetical protein
MWKLSGDYQCEDIEPMLGAQSIDYGYTSVPLTNLMVMAYFFSSAICCVVIYLFNFILVVRVKHVVFNCNSKILECAIAYALYVHDGEK